MTKLTTSLFAALLLLVGFTASASAQCQGKAHDIQKTGHGYGYGHGKTSGHGYRNYDKDAMVKALNLTEEQRAKVKDIWTNVQKESITLGAEVQKVGIDIGTALSGNEPDFNAAKTASKKLGELKIKIKENYFTALEATYNLLTPEQKKNWGQAMQDFRKPPSAIKDCPLKGTKECPLAQQQGA